MEDILKRMSYDENATRDAFSMLNLGDKFILNFNVYEDFVENFISKLKTPAEKTSIRRKFNTLKPKMDRKIKLYFKKVAKEMGYFEIKPDVFDRSLGQFKKSWKDILKTDLTPEDEKEIENLMRFENLTREDAERKYRKKTGKIPKRNPPTGRLVKEDKE